MSYGDRGPPKGYSTPRDQAAETGPAKCQRCDGAHWTFECKKPAAVHQPRLSRTQLLKRGIRAQAVAKAAPKTEREEFAAELKERAAMLEAELRAEAGLAPLAEARPSVAEAERKRPRLDSEDRVPTPPPPPQDEGVDAGKDDDCFSELSAEEAP